MVGQTSQSWVQEGTLYNAGEFQILYVFEMRFLKRFICQTD